MKTRKLLAFITLSFLFVFVISYLYFLQEKHNTVDIIKINDVVKSVEEMIREKGQIIEKSGNRNGMVYNLIWKEDYNYEATINESVQKHRIILDLKNQEENIGKIIFTNYDAEQKQKEKHLFIFLCIFVGLVWSIVMIVVILLHIHIIKPFQTMQQFARKVAKGDLDVPLNMQKDNYFGAFTESFDLMREELKKSRQAQYDVNQSKKELVAELSHDIKTPISTIKAICELMQAKLAGNLTIEEKSGKENEITKLLAFQEDKLSIIYNKADRIDQLVSNMFHATLEELEMLKIEPRETESLIIQTILQEMNHYNKIHLKKNLPTCLIYCDSLRLSQVIENIISNSYKYADTDVDIQFEVNKDEKLFIMKIKDYGSGVAMEDMPLLTQKYYRGKSDKVKNISGSGLGMYLAKIFMEGMKGTLHYYNEEGFVVEIGIRLV